MRPKVGLLFVDPVLFPPVQPYGLQVVAAMLEANGFATEVCCPFLSENYTRTVDEFLVRFAPDLVGLSFRNFDVACIGNDGQTRVFMSELADVVARISDRGIPCVIGGSGFAIDPAKVLTATRLDVGFVGPTERAFAEYCRRVLILHMTSLEAAEGLDGCITRDGAGPVAVARCDGGLGTPTELNASSVEYAKLAGGTIPLRTKAGCSLRCTYCAIPAIEPLVLREWADVSRELRMICEAGLGDRVFFADSEFNLPSIERALWLCEHIRAEFGDAVRWRCYLEAGFVSEQLVDAMVESGCVAVSLTVDSFASAPRIGFAKRTNPAAALAAVDLLLSRRVETCITLLFGGPGETLETVGETLDATERAIERGAQAAIGAGLRVYPRTPLSRLVLNERYRRHLYVNDPDDVPVFCSPVPPQELQHQIYQRTQGWRRTVLEWHVGSNSRFYARLAALSRAINSRNTEDAAVRLRGLQDEYPERRELQLAELKLESLRRFSGEDNVRIAR